jgi:hypothetical protein
MCLSYIDEVKKIHRVGIKLVHKTAYKNKFTSTVYGTVYTLGKWFDAGSTLPEVESISINGKKIKYLAGCHYYRTLKNLFIPETSVILKVRVRGVITTGLQDGVEAGVCRNILPVRIIKSKPKVIKTGDIKDLLKITKCACLLDIFDRGTQNEIPTMEQIKSACEFITKSPENFMAAICFIDHFERDHKVFKFFTKIHLALSNSKSIFVDPIYVKMYNSVAIIQDKNMMKLNKFYSDKINAANIPFIEKGQVA